MLLISLLFIINLIHAGALPLVKTQSVATDLLHPKTFKPMSSEQALALRPTVDLSKLEPEKTTYYDGQSKNLKQKNSSINIQDLSTLTLTEFPSYQTLDLTQLIAENNDGQKFFIYFGPKSHNLVLRNGLLAKIGYYTQPIKHQLTLNLNVQNKSDALSLLQRLQSNLIFKKTNRWIKNLKREYTNDKWVWKYTQENLDVIQLQDVIITPIANKTFDLDFSYIKADIIDGFRSLNALLIPYSLVEVPESINKFLSQPGKIQDKKMYLDFSLQNSNVDSFSTTIEDAQWITRKLSKLSKQDYKEIVSQVKYPYPELSDLLVEKLLARRNWLVQQLLNNENINTLKTNLKFSKGIVENGVIQKQTQYTKPEDVLDSKKWYVGYGSRFSFEQKEAPISWDQIQSYLWTLFSTNIQSNIVSQINKELPQTNIEKKAAKNIIDFQIDSFFDCILTSDCDPGTDYWNTPFYKFKLLNQRAVQFGSVFGTDNQIQLVEEFGVGLDVGIFFSALGLDPSEVLNAKLDAGYLRKWTHIKPLASIKETLKNEYHYKILPKFKSLIVPYNQYKLGHSLKELENGSIDQLSTEMSDKLEMSEQQKAVDLLLDQLLQDFSIGQSYIVSDQISFGPSINFGKKLSNNWQLNASTSSKILDLARMHIYRASEDTLHIYISKAVLSESDLNLNLNLYIPILSSYWGYKNSIDLKSCLIQQQQEVKIIKPSEYVTQTKSSCSPITNFYTLNISKVSSILNQLKKQSHFNETQPSDSVEDVIKTIAQDHTNDLMQNLKLISKALTNYSIAKTNQTLQSMKLSSKIQHNFTESTWRMSLLSKQWFSANTSDEIDIQVIKPASEVSSIAFDEDDLLIQRKKILHHKMAKRSGNNYQKLLTDVANWFINDKIDNKDINVTVPGNGNPGDSIYGHATQRKLSLEAVIDNDFIEDPVIKIQLNHKGWKLSFESTIELIKDLNNKFGKNFIDPELFYGMSEYQLYQIQVDHIIFTDGLLYLIQKRPEFFKRLFKHANVKLYPNELKRAHDDFITLEDALDDKRHKAYIQFKRKSKKLYRAYHKKDLSDFKDLSLEIVDYLDSLFDYKELNQFFGEGKSHNNSYVYANLSGFKKGLENSLEDIKSIHLGEIGQYPFGGPADYYRKEYLNAMSPGEFYLTWILEAY